MRIAIIGGGAAGFMAAITAKELNPKANVIIFEKTDKSLAKVKISGGGRCNVTNATFSVSKLVKNYPRGGKKLKKSLKLNVWSKYNNLEHENVNLPDEVMDSN